MTAWACGCPLLQLPQQSSRPSSLTAPRLPAIPRYRLAGRRSALHAAYRAPLDWVEQQTTGAADAIVVNSCFTQGACCTLWTN